MQQETLRKKLELLFLSRGLRTTGFRRALRLLAEEKAIADIEDFDDGDECCDITLTKRTDDIYTEWFGTPNIVPAAFKVVKDNCACGRDHVHVYEVSTTGRIATSKMAQYGCIADGDGPCITLHIIDERGMELSIGCDALMPFAFVHANGARWCWANVRSQCVWSGSTLATEIAAPPIHSSVEKERAILRAVYELGLVEPGELA